MEQPVLLLVLVVLGLMVPVELEAVLLFKDNRLELVAQAVVLLKVNAWQMPVVVLVVLGLMVLVGLEAVLLLKDNRLELVAQAVVLLKVNAWQMPVVQYQIFF